MGLTTTFYSGLSGLNVNQTSLDVTGNNIANVNTTAFKGSRAMFESQFSMTSSLGSAPNETSGGSNPVQIGLGATMGSIQRDFTDGSIETTGVPTQMAIQGNGMFIVNRPDGQVAYTRDGSFSLNANAQLVTSDGAMVQGYTVDDNFEVIEGTLSSLTIPLGRVTRASSTTNTLFDGNLDASGDVGTTGAVLTSQALVDNATGLAATDATLMVNIRDGGNAPFANGDVLTLSPSKGGRNLADETFTIGAATTMGQYTDWLEDTLGINTAVGVPGSPGVNMSAAGEIVITGNIGEENDLTINASDLSSTNAAFPAPLQFDKTAADGAAVFTSAQVYDTLGTPVMVNMTFVLESKTSDGNTWRFYAESADDTDTDRVIGTGTITFDPEGVYQRSTGNELIVNRANTGASDPISFTLDLTRMTGLDTQTSTVVMTSQDGYPAGSLSTFAVGPDGTVTGTFTNGLTKPLGVVALATFSNPEGMVAITDNMYVASANSGLPVVGRPEELGAGSIVAGALELSNVDLTREFISMITASTGFSGSARVISSSQQLLADLLATVRI